MPFEISSFQLPSGARCARAEVSGTITGEEAAAMVAHLDLGGPYHGLSLLVRAQKVKAMLPEARAVFSNRRAPPPTEWMAVVLTNPIIRVTSNFILRMNGNTRRRLFSTEPEAIQWLDERVREDVARAKTGAP